MPATRSVSLQLLLPIIRRLRIYTGCPEIKNIISHGVQCESCKTKNQVFSNCVKKCNDVMDFFACKLINTFFLSGLQLIGRRMHKV